jgi:hypothetical protein
MKLLLLALMLVVIGLIQVLPQVDLPDTAFHENEAPAVAKFRLVSAPVIVSITVATGLIFETATVTPKHLSVPVHQSTSAPLPALLSVFLC